MTPVEAFAAFLAAASIVVVTPGMDTALVLRTAAAEGPGRGLLATVGIALGCLTWGASVALGLGAILLASRAAYTVVKWAGAAYLAWLGLRMLLAPRRALAVSRGALAAGGRFEPLRRGIASNLLNPKAGVFYVSFLPMFVPRGWPVAETVFGLCLVHIAISVAWLALISAAAAPLGRWLASRGVVTWLDRVTGAVFLAFSAGLAFAEPG